MEITPSLIIFNRKFCIVALLIVVLSACGSPVTSIVIPTLPATATEPPIIEVNTQTPLPTTDSTQYLTESNIPRVSVTDAKAALDSNKAIIIDVRSPNLYALSHIKGSINIPLATILPDVNALNVSKSQWIITYCT